MIDEIKAATLTALAVILLSLTSCTNESRDTPPETTDFLEQSTEASILSKEALPVCENLECWNGIQLGSTTWAEAQALLEINYGKESVTANHPILNWTSSGQDGNSNAGSLHVTAQEITSEVYLSFPSSRLTIAELISQFGEPQHVWVARAFSSEVQCAGSLIAFPAIGLHAWPTPEDIFVGVSPAQSINRVRWLIPEQARNWTITDHVKVDWQGYMDYCEVAWPQSPE